MPQTTNNHRFHASAGRRLETGSSLEKRALDWVTSHFLGWWWWWGGVVVTAVYLAPPMVAARETPTDWLAGCVETDTTTTIISLLFLWYGC